MGPILWAATQTRTIATSARSRDPLAEPCTLYSVQNTNRGRMRKVRWRRTSTPKRRPTWMEKLLMNRGRTNPIWLAALGMTIKPANDNSYDGQSELLTKKL